MKNKSCIVMFLATLLLIACQNTNKKETADAYAPSFPLAEFVRPVDVNPIIAPDSTTRFYCPLTGDSVAWESNDTFNPAATTFGDKVVVFYRAEDCRGRGIGQRTSRLGYAESEDGILFKRDRYPVFYPAEDSQIDLEWPGGCEDPRIAVTEDGLYVMLYTQWNQKLPRLAVATSKDLRTWTKHGPAFAKAYDGRFFNTFSKSASVVTSLKNGRMVITKVNGKYLMYWGEKAICAAVSENLVDWTPILDEKGELLKLHAPRRGCFDSGLTECGPPAVIGKDGIILLYNGKNKAGEEGDSNYTANAYCAGQILFDLKEPMKVLQILDKPFLVPSDAFEKSGQYPAGTVFIEGLVYYQNKWFLYYGCADSRVAVAVYDPRNNNLK